MVVLTDDWSEIVVKDMSEIEKRILQMRIDSIKMTYNAGNTGAHIGGALSLMEIMAVLYLCIMKYDVSNPEWELRDRLILSKGHGVMAQYAAMKQVGVLKDEDLKTFKKNNTKLYAHPSKHSINGIEFSSGSLGQGLSLAVGVSLALRLKNNFSSRLFVIMGDGECDEGAVWEAAASASHFHCNNIVAIIDENKLQYDGHTDEIQNKSLLNNRWEGFGWKVISVDGHSVEELSSALSKRFDVPLVIIARTVKGKGVSFMENNPIWHNGRLSEKQFNEAMVELAGENEYEL